MNRQENKKTQDDMTLNPGNDLGYMWQEKKEEEDSSALKIVLIHR